MPPESGNGWERWRGEVSAKLQHMDESRAEDTARIEKKLDACTTALTEHAKADETKFAAVDTKIKAVEMDVGKVNTKLAYWSGIGAAVLFGANWLLRKFTG